MKQITAFLCAFFILFTLQAQNIKPAEVPSVVLDQFNFIYPFASRTSWKTENDHFRADFKNDKRKTTAVFQSKGALYKTMTEVNVSALPQPAIDFLMKNDPEAKIEDVRIIEDKQGVITFQAVHDKTKYVFDWAGHYVISGTIAVNEKD